MKTCRDEWGRQGEVGWAVKYQNLKWGILAWCATSPTPKQKVRQLQQQITNFQTLHPKHQDLEAE
jgi:hypothetical protein